MKFRIGVTLLLLMIAASAGAEPSLYASATANHTDMSISYLAMIFGHVGTVLQGSSGQMFGHLMGQFNKGIMVVAGVILGYNAVATVLRFTTEGTLMSPNRNTYMILFRITFGFALLVPSPQTGYNMVQRLLLTVVTHSVTFGDMVWSTALQQIERDGVWHMPSQGGDGGSGSSSSFSDDYTKSTLSTVANQTAVASISSVPTKDDIFQTDFQNQENVALAAGLKKNTAVTALPEVLFVHSLCTYVASKKNDDALLQPTFKNPETNTGEQNWNIDFPSSSSSPTGCGSIDVTPIANKIFNTAAASKTQKMRVSNMLYSMASDYSLVNTEYVCSHKDYFKFSNSTNLGCYNLPTVDGQIPRWIQDLGTTAQSNYRTVTQFVKDDMEQAASGFTGDQKSYIKQANSEGWIMAGAYYWGLAHLQAKHTSDLDYSQRGLNLSDPMTGLPSYITDKKPGIMQDVRRGTFYGYLRVHQSIMQKAAGASTLPVTAAVKPKKYDPGLGAAGFLLSPLLGGFTGDIAKLMDKFDNNAYFALRNINVGKMALCGAKYAGSGIQYAAMNMPVGTGMDPGVMPMPNSPNSTPFAAPGCGSSAQNAGLVGGFNSDNGMGSDPILWLSQIGSLCISIAGDLFFTAMLGTFAMGMIFIAFKACLDLGPGFEGAFKWLKPVIISGSALFLTVGLLLSFMVPLYPILVYILAVIGWLVLVIESVVAMPLVALGVTHPEGHDILGKGEQALMIILGVFLRPALMVMGLIAGMILSYVGLRILILGYSTFLVDLFNPFSATTAAKAAHGNIRAAAGIATGNFLLQGSSAFGAVVKALITYPVLLFIFASLAYQMVIASFSLIFALPDFVLRWIGGPQQPSAVSPAELVQGMTSHLQGGMQQMGKLGTEAAQNFMRRKPSDASEISGKTGTGTKSDKGEGG
jgi:defect in organelle trafficking protein DotA